MDFQFSYSVQGFALRYDVSRATVHRWLKSGKLGSLKVGNIRRITLNDERTFLDRYAVACKKGVQNG